MLEAASMAGVEFSAAAVAAGLGTEVEQIEEWCEGLARRQLFLRPTEVAMWPDGTVAAHYGFLHALYQDVLYERVTMTRRQRLHQRIGEREEAGYGEQAREIAAELAVHFERSRDYRRAVQYLGQAGENASAAVCSSGSDQSPHQRLWSCSRLCRTLLNAPSKNSRCKSLWARL